jgi:hypothetical protein
MRASILIQKKEKELHENWCVAAAADYYDTVNNNYSFGNTFAVAIAAR